MADYAPQFNLFVIIGRVKLFGKIMFWIIFAFSIYPCFIKYFPTLEKFADLANIANVVSIILFFILEIVVESILVPMAEQKRRDDFIDNSFGSRYALSNSRGYYSNDSVDQGEYKAAVNLFENCFFTYSLLRISTVRKIILPSTVFILILVIAYYGFREVPFALSLLQVLFSGSLLGGLVKYFVLINRIDVIQENWIKLFQVPDFKPSSSLYSADILRNWLRYETLISRLPVDLPNDVFKKNNARLTAEWDQIKAKYSIQ